MNVSFQFDPFRRLIAFAACISLIPPSSSAFAQMAPANALLPSNHVATSPRPAYRSNQLQDDARILHALNRFTFGPRPGDLAAVKAMGLDRWFDQQLHPASLDDTTLQARLAQYPAMQLSSQDLLVSFPSNAIIRQAIDGKAPIPDRGALHAIYENQIARVTAKKQEQAQKKDQQAAPTSANPSALQMNSQTTMAATAETPAQPTIDPTIIPAILALPPQQRVARLAAMQQPEFDSVFKSLKGPQRIALIGGMSPEMKETVAALENPERLVVDELMDQRLTRDIYSSAQLQQVMTDFWLNHFNVFLHKNETTPYDLVGYERDIVRPRALGKFEDLLEATAHSPAMLEYLDNSSSIGPDSQVAEKAKITAARQHNKKNASQGLNENYARELMELQTLGVNGGYTQADVTEVARILTGWTVDRPQRGGEFKFDPTRHEPGQKKVLHKKFKENSEREGQELLHFLATRPATAQFLSRKLAIRFVSDDPPQTLVNRMAKSYLKSGGDIAAVLKTMYRSPEFWSPAVYRAKVKTPLEYVVSAARASNADLANLQPLTNALRDMGMPLYGCVPPTGYKWDASDWVSTGALVNRMNFALSLAANRLPGITSTWASPPAITATQAPPITPASEEARLESTLLSGEVSDSTRSAVLQQFQQQIQSQTGPAPVNVSANLARNKPVKQGTTSLEKQDQLLAGLLLGSPEFQRR